MAVSASKNQYKILLIRPVRLIQLFLDWLVKVLNSNVDWICVQV